MSSRFSVFATMATIILLAAGTSPTADAQVADYLRQMGEQYSRGAPYWQKSGCSLPVWHAGQPMRVFLVPEGARKYGIEEGDYIISVNDKRVPDDNNEVTELLSAIAEDAVISLTVYRAGGFEKLTTQCQSATDIATALQELTAALLAADSNGCLSALDSFESLTEGTLSAGLMETRYQCQMISSPEEFYENRAGYLYISAERMLQETKYFPSQFQYSKDEVLRRIDTIRELGEEDLAARLRTLLNEAIAFVEADYPAPTVL